MTLIQRAMRHPLVMRVLKWRFLKFGTVGASGTVVNLAVLYIGQEFLFSAIAQPETRLNFSLAGAILVATINNFTWNRIWTWHDRRHLQVKPVLTQFVQYALACWLGILLQVVFTKILVVYLHYLLANLIAIVGASVFNFVVNDLWTFRHRKPPVGDADKPARKHG
ncbi:MAG: GtrA family protein [Proteobacteria bacterium]|nr:GtrA family protein [Pseudomonadota bacterium]